MKHIYCLITLGLFISKVHAQQSFGCISHDVYAMQMEKNAEFRKNQAQLEAETRLLLNNRAQSRITATPAYIIPVVFHIIHTGGSGNISSAQVIDQINILNQEFNRLQPDTILTPAPFKAVAAPFSVEFRLATKDPQGNCTNGINRVYSSLSICSVQEDDVKALSYWPSNKYLNIWIVESMHYSSMATNDCSGGGYATFPGGVATLDGINIRGDLISNIGTSATNATWGNFKGRYLIHELGHWFNLRHIWGDANCGNDLVSDTPPALTSNSGCPSFPHNPSNACGSTASGEMFTDYMDYTNGPCLNMFTAGQVARMTAAITSPVSGRNNLWAPANLIATGTGNPYTYPVSCAAIPEIFPLTQIVACAGDSVRFADYSYGGNSTSRLWSFNGEPASSLTDSIVKVFYALPGLYSVTLTKNYTGSSHTATFTNRVHILDNTPNINYIVPFKDTLEDYNSFDSEWAVINNNGDNVKWELTSSTSVSGSSCAGLQNFGSIGPATDDLISPAYNLTAVSNATLGFKVHYSRTSSENYDKLQVYISRNCGKTWTTIYQKSGSGLKTMNAFNTSPYTPAVASNEWREERVPVANALGADIVKFKFSFTSGGGNNIFIDDINVEGLNSTGFRKYNQQSNISLFPNPGNETLNISYELGSQAPIKIAVTDIMGRLCFEQVVSNISSGQNKTALNTGALKDGVYLISIKQNSTVIYNSKFIKQSAE